MHNAKAKELLSILKKERMAILAGDFDAIHELSPAKMALFNNAHNELVGSLQLTNIREELARNQNLLQAAIEGVASAQVRLEALREVRDGLRVYNQAGQFAQTTTGHTALTKRS